MKVNALLANNFFRDSAAAPRAPNATTKIPPSDATQLSMLGSVLNGLDSGASANKRQVDQLMVAVRSGSYNVDPLALSSRIINDALAR